MTYIFIAYKYWGANYSLRFKKKTVRKIKKIHLKGYSVQKTVTGVYANHDLRLESRKFEIAIFQ